jgi:hypothetical protein
VGHGVVGSGKECPGEVWFGKVRHGKARLCPVWWGVEWLGGVWFGKARFSNSSLQKDALKKLDQGEAWHGAVGCGKARHGLVW